MLEKLSWVSGGKSRQIHCLVDCRVHAALRANAAASDWGCERGGTEVWAVQGKELGTLEGSKSL